MKKTEKKIGSILYRWLSALVILAFVLVATVGFFVKKLPNRHSRLDSLTR